MVAKGIPSFLRKLYLFSGVLGIIHDDLLRQRFKISLPYKRKKIKRKRKKFSSGVLYLSFISLMTHDCHGFSSRKHEKKNSTK